MPDWTFYQHSGIHGACPSPCQWCMSMSMLNAHVSAHVHAAHHRCVSVCVFVCINAGLSSIQSVRYQNKKTNDAGTGPVPDQAKAVRHFFGPVPDWNFDAGMPMPALVSWMPMPSYAKTQLLQVRIWRTSCLRIPLTLSLLSCLSSYRFMGQGLYIGKCLPPWGGVENIRRCHLGGKKYEAGKRSGKI